MSQYVCITRYFRSGEPVYKISGPSTLEDAQKVMNRLTSLKNTNRNDLKIVELNLPAEKIAKFNLTTGVFWTANQLQDFLEENSKYTAQSLRFYSAKALVESQTAIPAGAASQEAMADIHSVAQFFNFDKSQF